MQAVLPIQIDDGLKLQLPAILNHRNHHGMQELLVQWSDRDKAM